MSSDVSTIFFGIPKQFTRELITEFLQKNKFEKYYVPFAGRFAIVQTMIEAGVEKDKIYCTDIGLFSSLVGYIIIEQPLESLNIRLDKLLPVKIEIEDTQLTKAAKVIYALKLSQLTSNRNKFFHNIAEEFKRNSSTYLAHIVNQLLEHHQRLQGIHYEIRDARDVITEIKDRDYFAFIDPPVYSGDYKKMFQSGFVQWNEPDISLWEPKEFRGIMEKCFESRCTMIANLYKSMAGAPNGWKAIGVHVVDKEKTNYLIANKPVNVLRIQNKFEVPLKPNFKIHSDEEITRQSRIKMLIIDRDVAYYYKDLFAHRLGSAKAQINIAWLVDGKIFCISGYDAQQSTLENLGYIHETYGIVKKSDKYTKLGRLFTYLTTSTEFQQKFAKIINFSGADFDGIKTVGFANNIPKIRGLRGLMKEIKKTEIGIKRWKIESFTKFHKRTFKQCLAEWLDENAKRERNADV